MKSFVLVVLLIGTGALMANKKPFDTGKVKRCHFNVELGHSNTFFMDYKKFPLGSKGNTPLFGITFYKVSCILRNNWVLSADYKNYGDMNFKMQDIGDIHFRHYHAFDLACGYQFSFKDNKIRVQPYGAISARPSGGELVLLGSNKYQEPPFNNYRYSSMGVGAGVNSQVVVKKRFTVGLEIQYNYYFEKNKMVGRSKARDKSFDSTFKVNRHMVTPSVKVGVLF
jgi:hypothetical protein